MAGIFISYRRADSDGWAGRLRDALRVRFGDIVFQDVDNIADGEIFSEVIDRALQACDVALIIIGPTWASARDEQGRRRLDLEDDWVRTETAMVLERKIRVIPVLVGGARLPRVEELPEELRSLTRRQAREIRSTSWDSDVALLASHLQQIVGYPRRRLWLYAAPAVLVAAVLGVFVGSRFFGAPETEPVSPFSSRADEQGRYDPSIVLAEPPRLAERAAESHAPDPKTSVTDVQPPRPTKERAAEVPTPAARPSAADGAAKARVAETPASVPRSVPDAQLPRTAKERPGETPASKTFVADAQSSRPVKERVAETPAPAAKSSLTANKTDAAVKAPDAVQSAPRLEPRPPSAAPADTPRTEVGTTTADASAQAATESAKAPERVTEAAPAERSSTSPPPDTGVTGATVARVVPISLPNRSHSARELKVGDSWTYRLRELAYNRESVTVTHELRGGDTTGIREVIRIGDRKAEGDAGGTQRRLTLEPRIFEQRVDANATLFEFAPFLTAFSDVRPGLAWNEIAVAQGGDEWRLSGKVIGRESVRTPAGTFEAIKAELQGRRELTFPTTRDVYYETIASRLTYSIWFVPEIGRAVKYDRRAFNRASRLLEHEQYELVSYQLK